MYRKKIVWGGYSTVLLLKKESSRTGLGEDRTPNLYLGI